MSWNVRQIYHDQAEFPYVALHEVYYTPAGDIERFTTEPVQILSEDAEGFAGIFRLVNKRYKNRCSIGLIYLD